MITIIRLLRKVKNILIIIPTFFKVYFMEDPTRFKYKRHSVIYCVKIKNPVGLPWSEC